jgi:hypothetical protein
MAEELEEKRFKEMNTIRNLYTHIHAYPTDKWGRKERNKTANN